MNTLRAAGATVAVGVALLVAGLLGIVDMGPMVPDRPSAKATACASAKRGHVIALQVQVVGQPRTLDAYTNRIDVVWWLNAENNGSKTYQRRSWHNAGTVLCGHEVRVTGTVHARGLQLRCIIRDNGAVVKQPPAQAGGCQAKYTVP